VLHDSESSPRREGDRNSKTNEKESYTAYDCISALGEKIPCWILPKRKTSRSETKFGPHPDVILKHTESGWSPDQMIVEYVTWLLQRCGSDGFVLVLDLYSAHALASSGAATLSGIVLRTRWGSINSPIPRSTHIRGTESPGERGLLSQSLAKGGFGLGPSDAIANFIRAREAISPENVRKAWLLSEISPDTTSEDISQ
jgi:hypothetical protein